jgi:hypothetical protein
MPSQVQELGPERVIVEAGGERMLDGAVGSAAASSTIVCGP